MVEPRVEQLTPLQNAVYLLKQAQAKLAAYEQVQAEPIAVIGMGCRFPGGVENPASFWSLLQGGVDAIREVPADRWNIDDFYDPDPGAAGKMNTRWGGFVQRVAEFDADFFGISPREAVRVDPQQRLLLEVAWEALEDAGLPSGDLAQRKAGVYVGVIGSDYGLLQSRRYDDMDIFSGTGVSHAILANRVSYVLNLNGPSVTLDTACSSSLVTVHLACQSLRRRESDVALAGGVNLIISPEMTMALSKAHMLAPDGRCKTFDASANGYVRGEGCGLVVLKRLSDALADGDRIAALIRGSGVNHDGRSNGLSAPNGLAQEAVIRAALAEARLTPNAVSYIEAHGTGTRLGDPIEIEALRTVYCTGRSPQQPLVVGSVKTNIGHLESAAGIAGLIKVILMLRQGQIAPHLHLQTANPLLRLEESPIEIPSTLRPWAHGSQPRRAGVSSFGFGGTNAHVIIEESPRIEFQVVKGSGRGPTAGESLTSGVERPRHLLTLSARSDQALTELAGRLADYVEAHPTASLADVAFTANTGRMHFAHRAAIGAASLEKLTHNLRSCAADAPASDIQRGVIDQDRPPRIAFLFTGQGAQYAGMGYQLVQTQPTFRAAIEACAEILRPLLDRPLLSLLDPSAGPLLDQTGYTQPVMFALQYALATLWRSWGLEPAAVLGHSVGEFAAACVAGVFSLEDGLRLIAERARLMQSLPPGGLMAAVFATASQVSSALAAFTSRVTIAALNGPENVVISGDEPAVRELLARFATDGIRSKTLVTSHAFHSQHMEPMLDQLRQAAASLACSTPKLDLIANLTGQLATAETYADPAYWSRHAREPVQFAASVQLLATRGCEVFLEIGPSPTLIGLGRRCLPDGDFAWLPSLRPGRDNWQTLLDSLAQLYSRGAKIDWMGFDRDYRRHKTELPTYPFQRRHYWFNITADGNGPASAASSRHARVVHPLLGRRVVAATEEQIFESQLAAQRPALLADHKLQGVVIMPGAAYLEMVLAASAVWRGKSWQVCGASLVEPLLLNKTPKTVQTILKPTGPQTASFRIVSLVETSDASVEPSFMTHAVGQLEAPADRPAEHLDIDQQRARFSGEPLDDAWRAAALRKSGLEPGPTFCWISWHWVNGPETWAELRPPRDGDRVDEYQLHPGLLDSVFQLLGAALPGAGTGIDAYIPLSVKRLQVFERPQGETRCLTSLTTFDGQQALGDVHLLDTSGRVLVTMEGVCLRRVPRNWLARLTAGPLPDWSCQLAWIPQSLDATPIEHTSISPGQWLIFDSQAKLGVSVAASLELKAHRCRLIPAGGDAAARRTAVQEFLSTPQTNARGVVYLSGLDVDGQTAAPDFQAAEDYGWGGVLDVAQALSAAGIAKPPRLWLVTCGAQAVGERSQPVSLGQAPVWGLGRVIAAEHPELACTRVDLDPEASAAQAQQLVEELWAGQAEDQVAYRGGQRHVARLRRLRQAAAEALKSPRGQPYRLEITTRGQLDNVALQPLTRQLPGPGQVEIQVRATGLNFRDVLNVLDLYPGDPGPLGGECAGEITAVGSGVEHLKPGDQVIALAPGSFASYVLTLAEFVAPQPAQLSAEQGATIPICFLTVHQALRRLGRLQPGERVLIHAASGGVGLAAIQIAKQIGAEIFATAGSPRKRDYLRALGIEHVFDSRTLDFADQIRAATAGQGLDLVLNSLTGDAIGASLSLLREGGRFVELGKTDLWDQARVDQFQPGVRFFAIALDRMLAEEPQTVEQLLQEVVPQFTDGRLQPLPLRTFRMQHAVQALRHMARAEHIGKVILQAAAASDFGEQAFALREDGTYLVTGGLGGLGLKLARWLTDHGARHLVLLGRSAPSEEALSQLAALQATGAQVVCRRCDVSQRTEVAAVLDEISSQLPPLRGIFHLAGTLDDGVLREQTRERFERVMASKVWGAWHLHELTRDVPLDLFVLFSSAAALLGSPGQGNYAAANAFLDALAHQRRWEQRPALSVNWGSWAEVGMAAKLKETEGQRWAAAGIGWIEPAQGLETLAQLIVEDRVQAGVLPINWPKFFERIPAGSEPPWLVDMAREARAATAAPSDHSSPELLEQLRTITPAERLELTLTHIRQQAARVLGLEAAQLPDPRRTLNELGFDSLTAVEFCNRVGRSIGQHLNPALLFDYPTLESLAGHVLRDLLHLNTVETDTVETPPTTPTVEAAVEAVEAAVDESRVQTLADVEVMSEQEMEALVNQQLERLQP